MAQLKNNFILIGKMIQKNRYLVIFFISVLYSCKSLDKKDVLGVYEYESPISIGKLILNDTTFEYSYDIPLASYVSKGTWSLKQDTIVFQSYGTYKSNFLFVKESIGKKSYIQVLNENGVPLRMIKVVINDNVTKETDINGEIYIDNYLEGKIIKVAINNEYVDIDVDKSIYYPKSKKSNIFIIKVVPDSPEKRFFDREAIKIKHKKIIIDNREHIKSNN